MRQVAVSERLINIYLLLVALLIIAVFLHEQVENLCQEFPRVRVSVALLGAKEESGHARPA